MEHIEQAPRTPTLMRGGAHSECGLGGVAEVPVYALDSVLELLTIGQQALVWR
jgi:hypothetical protein